jgi:hypothetical protein
MIETLVFMTLLESSPEIFFSATGLRTSKLTAWGKSGLAILMKAYLAIMAGRHPLAAPDFVALRTRGKESGSMSLLQGSTVFAIAMHSTIRVMVYGHVITRNSRSSVSAQTGRSTDGTPNDPVVERLPQEIIMSCDTGDMANAEVCANCWHSRGGTLTYRRNHFRPSLRDGSIQCYRYRPGHGVAPLRW